MFYRARWYDPLTGRFLSADTIVPGAGNPQSLNRYMYVLGNPLKYTDESGHIPFLPPLIGGALGLVAGVTLYSINTVSSGQNWEKWDLGEAMVAGGTGAVAGALIGTGFGTPAGAAMFAGIGIASGATGYLAVNIITASEFNTVDFAIASTVGGVTGILAPTVATTAGGAIALNGVANVAQYGLSQIAHDQPITAEGAAWAAVWGILGGAIGGKMPALTAATRGAFPGATLTFGLEEFPEMFASAVWRQFTGGSVRSFGGSIISSLPQPDDLCQTEGPC